jgi:hypothetical protein
MTAGRKQSTGAHQVRNMYAHAEQLGSSGPTVTHLQDLREMQRCRATRDAELLESPEDEGAGQAHFVLSEFLYDRVRAVGYRFG